MNLGIISDCLHVKDMNGRIGSFVHIFVRQMDCLSSDFDCTIICAPVISLNESHPTISYYENPAIRFIELPQVGGSKLSDKIKLIRTIPVWIKAFIKLSAQTDIFYQRFPNNLNIPGFFYSHIVGKKKFASFTGTWEGYKGESLTYRLQRLALLRLFNGPVFVYSVDKIDNERIFSNFSPSYTNSEWQEEEHNLQIRFQRILDFSSKSKLILINVGSLIPYKNQIFLLESAKLLNEHKINFHLYVVGHGQEHKNLYNFIIKNSLENHITLTGQLSPSLLRNLYHEADFLIQPSLIEGYGKVPIEGMLHGVVPILSNITLHPYFVGKDRERGGIFTCDDPQNIVDSLMLFINNKDRWRSALIAGRQFSFSFTMENWKLKIISSLKKYFGKQIKDI